MSSVQILSKPKSLLNMAKITTKLALVSSALLITFSSHSAQKSYDNLHKQLDIMNNIMMSSAKASSNSGKSLIRSIDSVYLQGQGAVFTINSGIGGSLQHQFFQMVSPVAPVSMMPPSRGGNRAFIEDNDFDIEIDDIEGHEDEFERVIEIYEEQREGARELRSEQREITYQLRDIDRQKKDIEYQLKHVEKNTKSELTSQLKKIEKERVTLTKDKNQLEQKVVKQNKQLKEQKVVQQKARTEHFNTLNDTLVETLCLYGNGLQAIPNKEHVSLIIKKAGNKKGRNYKDQVIVFTKKDINACASNKLTAKKLLTKAEQYQF